MAATPTNPAVDARPEARAASPLSAVPENGHKPTSRDALQALLAFSALHDQIRRRKTLATRYTALDSKASPEFEPEELFALDEVLQLVAERAVSITGADGLAVALADHNEIVLRAAAGTICPDVGQRIDRDSAFSGACFRTAQVIRCDDTETDPRVNLEACRRLGARSMVAVPLCGRRRVIGLLEAFSADPSGFNESDVRNLELLAEIILGALKPEDEDRFTASASIAATVLGPPIAPPSKPPVPVPVPSAPVAAQPSSVPENKPPVVPTPAHSLRLVEPAAEAVKSIEPIAVLKTPNSPVAVSQAQPIVSSAVDRDELIASDTPDAIAHEASANAIKATPAQDDDLSESGRHAVDQTETINENPLPEAVATEMLPEPYAAETLELASLQQSSAAYRPSVILWLLLVVVAGVAAAGIWWKGTTEQIGHAMIRRAAKATARRDAPAPESAAATPAPAQSANTTAEKPSPDSGLDGAAPASSQELSHMPRVTGLRHWASDGSSTVTLDLDDQVQYEAHRLSNPERIYFDLHDTALAASLANKIEEVGDPLLSRVRLAQPVPGITRLVLETKANANFSVSLEPSPYRLVVTVYKAGTEPKPRAELFPGQAQAEAERRQAAIVIPPPNKEDAQLRAHVPKMRIVVDAGHGGWDLGTVGKKGLLEKDLALEVSQRLGKLLESRLGASVIFTRSDDVYIPLDQRAGLANQAQADLFISIHANYSDLPSARGVETYYARSFVSSVHAEGSDSKALMPVILSPADLREKVQDSARLAETVQHVLYTTLAGQNPGIRNRGVKPAGFVVLTGTSMPAILAEISFVSSPTDEQKLLSDGYREQIAEALYKGIAHYAANSRPVKIASAGR